MKLKWILLGCCGLVTAPALAAETIVIDEQTLAEQAAREPAAATAAVPSPALPATDPGRDVQPNDATAAQAEAIRERMPPEKMSARQRRAITRIETAEENRLKGAAFRADNQTKAGVVTLPSGVQYHILTAGKGRKPKPDGLVVCRYRGTLIDGTVFEQTGARPLSTYAATLLPGLREAVLLMPAGSKWEIVVPPELGYRDLGNRLVGPNATLIYDLELIGVK